MSYALDSFEICHILTDSFKKQIKLFYLFSNLKKYNLLLTTNKDKTYGFGYNSFGLLGLGHNLCVNEMTVIPDLCDKNIIEFYNGWDFIIAINKNRNKLFGWGRNHFGQLGRGYSNEENDLLTPNKAKLTKNIWIKQISCGYRHTLVLDVNGLVFGWGDNYYGQLGCETIERRSHWINSPRSIDFFKQRNITIAYISCSEFQSFAVTIDGFVYSFGKNYSHKLGQSLDINDSIFLPKVIKGLNNVNSVSIALNNTYFLCNDGKRLYFCGFIKNNSENNENIYQIRPKLMTTTIKFNKLFSKTIAIAISDDNIFELKENNILETNFINIFDFYSEKLKITYKTIRITKSNSKISQNNFIINALQSKKLNILTKDYNEFRIRFRGFRLWNNIIEHQIHSVRDKQSIQSISEYLNGIKARIEEKQLEFISFGELAEKIAKPNITPFIRNIIGKSVETVIQIRDDLIVEWQLRREYLQQLIDFKTNSTKINNFIKDYNNILDPKSEINANNFEEYDRLHQKYLSITIQIQENQNIIEIMKQNTEKLIPISKKMVSEVKLEFEKITYVWNRLLKNSVRKGQQFEELKEILIFKQNIKPKYKEFIKLYDIGAGTFGNVSKVKDNKDNQVYAVKMVTLSGIQLT